jgi:hypothetical protein
VLAMTPLAWPELNNPVRARFVWCFGAEGEFPRPADCELCPTRFYVREGLLAVLGTAAGTVCRYDDVPMKDSDGVVSFNQFLRRLRDRRGFLAPSQLKDKPLGIDRVATAEAMVPLYDSWAASKEDLDSLARFTQDNGILLIIRLTPMQVECRNKKREQQMAEFCDWLRDVEQQYRHVTVSRPEIVWYQQELCFNVNHCNYQGAERFTRFFAEEINCILAKRALRG